MIRIISHLQLFGSKAPRLRAALAQAPDGHACVARKREESNGHFTLKWTQCFNLSLSFKVFLQFVLIFEGVSSIFPCLSSIVPYLSRCFFNLSLSFKVFLQFFLIFQGVSSIFPYLSGCFFNCSLSFKVFLQFFLIFQGVSSILPYLSRCFFNCSYLSRCFFNFSLPFKVFLQIWGQSTLKLLGVAFNVDPIRLMVAKFISHHKRNPGMLIPRK